MTAAQSMESLAIIEGSCILLVEDNAYQPEIAASEILPMPGLVVDVAEDGSIALEMVQARVLRYCADGHADARHGRDQGHQGNPQRLQASKSCPFLP